MVDNDDSGRAVEQAAEHQERDERQFGPDLSGISPLTRQLIGGAMIAAFVGFILLAMYIA